MTPAAPRPSPGPGLWSRRWVRRLTYVIAAGGLLTGLVAWAVQRPNVDRWLIARLDLLARRECGLGVRAQRLEIHPFRGQIRLHQLAVGDDLFQADLLELDLDLASLLHTPRIRSLRLLGPVLNLDQARLDRIRLKPRPPSPTTPQFRLDRLLVSDGRIHVREPAWGLPKADCQFQVTGKGWTANQVWLQLSVPVLTLDNGQGPVQGDLSLAAQVTEHRLDLDQAALRLGVNRLTAKGSYLYTRRQLSLAAKGHLDLARVLAMAGRKTPEASGLVDFQVQVDGPPDRLDWNGSIQGLGLQARGLPLHPGSLRATAWGTPSRIQLERLAWSSRDARVEATGDWSPDAGCRLQASAEDIPLAPVAGYTRTGFLKDLTARLSGEVRVPGAPWAPVQLDQVTFHGQGQFLHDGERVGGLALDLEQSRFQAGSVTFAMPALTFDGKASGLLGPHGLASVAAEGGLATDAADVSGVLRAWDIGTRDAAGRLEGLDMAGLTQAWATFSWEPATGIQLIGHVEAAGPRWHGARADQLRAQVAIDREVLRVTDIGLEKGDGSGSGELWLTWADLPPGSEQLDMCYQASRLPIEEGLRAADVGDLDIRGTGSGWVRLHGGFDRILLEGQGRAERAEVYGLRVPAASADFAMDIAGDRLRCTDVRIADSVADLGPGDGGPTGLLALQGAMDMDLQRATWRTSLRGRLDSAELGLPGPRLETQVDAHLDGPFTAPFGPIQLPGGGLTFTGGRITAGDQRLDGLEGSLQFARGELQASLGLTGKPRPLVSLAAAQRGPDHLAGNLELELDEQTADSAQLAAQLTQDFLKDARFRFHAQGDWGPGGFRWDGRMDGFTGQFEGFSLVQAGPGRFRGDLAGLELSMGLEGVTSAAPGAGPGPAEPAGAPRERPGMSVTSMTISGRLPFATTQPLDLKLAGGSNLANLKVILDRLIQPGQYSLLADLHPAGRAQFDLNLGGSLDDTTLDGTLALQDGRMVVHSYPLSIEDLAFTAKFQGRDILIPKSAPLRGTLAQGALTAWGKATWNLGGISAYELHTSLEDFQLRDLPDGLEIQGSLDATLKGSDLDGGLLSGSIWTKRTLYRTEINLSDLILANALAGTQAFSTLDPSDPLARIDLDLELHLAEPWELDTNIVKLQGRPKGPFWIRGNLTQPGLKGRMELLPGGRITNLFPAGDVVLERGTVEFTDPTFFNPNFDIQGQIDVQPYLVTLNISGTLDALQARPFSSPSLRQDEIFAILIDPAAVNTVGGTPGSSTQTALTSGLAGTSSGLLTSLALANFQEQLRKTLNLDRVSVALRTGVGAPATSITLGTSFNLLGYRTPLVFTHDKAGELTTLSGQVEWRFGDFVLHLGASQSTADTLAPSGEIRHTWSPR